MRAAIAIDLTSDVPIHRQIYEAWRSGILAGRFRKGDRVPSSRELAITLQIARSTVTHAYDQLFAEGYLQTARGSGTYVSGDIHDDGLPCTDPRGRARRVRSVRLSRFGERLETDFIHPPQPADHICFSRWTPDVERFPLNVWRTLLNRHLRAAGREMLGYARQSQGDERLRTEIAAYLRRSRAVECTLEHVVVLNGSQQALDLCARVLCETGEIAAFENPGYLGTKRIFDSHGLRLAPVPVDAHGMLVSEIDPRSRLIYVTPSHQFPTGVSMSLPRRLELIAWARRHNAFILEDDYDSEYRYSGPPLPSLQGLARDVPVIYCGTFSKVMFPGLRIGYAVLPEALVAPFRRAKWIADRSTPALEQAALADFIAEGHLERHLRRMRKLYGGRRNVLVGELRKRFGSDVQILGDAAGMHLAVRFQNQQVAQRAAANKVQIVSTREYYLRHPRRNEFILGFSSLSEHAIREGVRRLAD